MCDHLEKIFIDTHNGINTCYQEALTSVNEIQNISPFANISDACE